jgi:magnesium-transporting ATPase (P-type)
LRVLALAFRRIDGEVPRDALETHLTLLGLVAFEDLPRSEVPAAVARCHTAGVRIIMISGDHPQTALAVGRQIGLFQEAPHLITGDALRESPTRSCSSRWTRRTSSSRGWMPIRNCVSYGRFSTRARSLPRPATA